MDDEFFWVNLVPWLGPFEVVRIMCMTSKVSMSVLSNVVFSISVVNLAELVKTCKSRHSMLDTVMSVVYSHPSMIHSQCANGDTALHVSARRGDWLLVSLLVSFGADVNRVGAGDMTPLHCAAYGKSFRSIEILLNSGARSGEKDAMGRWPEDWATMQQCWDMATRLRHHRKRN